MFGFFEFHDVHLSPEIEGIVTLKGHPLSNVVITRELTYGKEYLDKTVTDVEGRFSMPAVNIRSQIPGKPLDETRNRQVIVAEHEGKKYVLWYAVTDSIKPEISVVEKLEYMNCELSKSEKLQHFTKQENPSFTHNIHSVCRWDGND